MPQTPRAPRPQFRRPLRGTRGDSRRSTLASSCRYDTPTENREAAMPKTLIVALALAAPSLAPGAQLQPDPPKTCENCAAWSTPRAPFRVFGNTWFVGDGLSS